MCDQADKNDNSHWLYRQNESYSDERKVAVAKILTMIQDLGGYILGENFNKNSDQNKKRIQHEAYLWFFSKKYRDEFEEWCDAAGFNPDYVRTKAKRIVDHGLPEWRAPAGKGKRYQERLHYRKKIKEECTL